MKQYMPVAIVVASMALAPIANAETIYIAGTHPLGSSATVTRNEATLMTGDSNAKIVQYPRQLAPLIGMMPLDQSVAQGVKNTPMLHDGDTVVCVSQGCIVSNAIKTNAQITRVNYGDPTNAAGGLLPKLGLKPATTTPDIAFEYDLIADAPDRPNPLSWANAVMGAAYTHNTYSKAAAEGPTETYGTHTIIKASNLPLTRPLRQLGVNKEIVDRLDKALKPVIDSGYKRNDTKKEVKHHETSHAHSGRNARHY